MSNLNDLAERIERADGPDRALYCYAVVVRRIEGPSTTWSHVLGYCVADSIDETKGIAVGRTFDTKPGFDVADMSVTPIPFDEVAAALRAQVQP